MKDDEIQLCNACCTIPTGRLAESLSLPHAVSIVLSRLYEHRWESEGSRLVCFFACLLFLKHMYIENTKTL